MLTEAIACLCLQSIQSISIRDNATCMFLLGAFGFKEPLTYDSRLANHVGRSRDWASIQKCMLSSPQSIRSLKATMNRPSKSFKLSLKD